MPNNNQHQGIDVNGKVFAASVTSLCQLFRHGGGMHGKIMGVFASAEVAKSYLAAYAKEPPSTMEWQQRGSIQVFYPPLGWGGGDRIVEDGGYFSIDPVTVMSAANPFEFEKRQPLQSSWS